MPEGHQLHAKWLIKIISLRYLKKINSERYLDKNTEILMTFELRVRLKLKKCISIRKLQRKGHIGMCVKC